MGIIQLGQSLGNGLQLFVTFQTTPCKGLAAALIDGIPNRLAQGSPYLDELGISAWVGSVEKGGSISGDCPVGPLGRPPKSWRIFLRSSSS